MNRIAELRKTKHLNQIGLAMKLNISQYLVSAYETGRHQPSIEILIQMSKIFNVSVDYIIGNSDIKSPAKEFDVQGLTNDEKELLTVFKELDEKSQQKAIGMVLALKHITNGSTL